MVKPFLKSFGFLMIFALDKDIDKNGIIRLSSPNHDLDNLVYPAQNRQFAYKHIFCYGRSIDELNDHLKSLQLL